MLHLTLVTKFLTKEPKDERDLFWLMVEENTVHIVGQAWQTYGEGARGCLRLLNYQITMSYCFLSASCGGLSIT